MAIYVSLTALFWHAYNIRYGNHSDCFNDQGRCFIPGEGVLTTSGAFWGLFALAFALLAVLKLLWIALILLRHRP